MRLILNKEQSTGVLGGGKLTLMAKVETTAEEEALIKKFNLGKEIIWQAEPGRTAKYIGVKTITVGTLMHGESHTCKNINEIMELEEVITTSAQGLKNMLSAVSSFGGETVIDL